MRLSLSGARGPRWLRVMALAVAGAFVLAACSGDGGGSITPDDVVNQGYVSGDGSVRIWAKDDRSKPVTLAGDDFADEAVDTSQWLGSIVVVNTWYAACPPCRAESPDLGKVARERESDGVKFVGLNRVDDTGAAQAFERTYDVPYPSIADRTGAVTAQLQGVVPVKATPTTVVLDRQGRVAARILGGTDATTLNTILSDVLGEDGAATPPAESETSSGPETSGPDTSAGTSDGASSTPDAEVST